MSAIAAFAIECAQAGRWVRALMALQGHANSTEPATREACLAVAQVSAAHAWQAALSLLHPMDAAMHTRQVCNVLDTVARHPRLSVADFERHVSAMLTTLSHGSAVSSGALTSASSQLSPTQRGDAVGSPAFSSSAAAPSLEVQRRVFLSATRWCGYETAARLLASLTPSAPSSSTQVLPAESVTAPTSASPPPPLPRSCVERVQALRSLRECVLHDIGPFAGWAGEENDPHSTIAGTQKKTKTTAAETNRGTNHSKVPSSSDTISSESLYAQLLRLQRKYPLNTERDSHPHHHDHRSSKKHRRYSARDRRELARLYDVKRQALLRRAHAVEVEAAQQAWTAVAPSAQSVCAALRCITRVTPPPPPPPPPRTRPDTSSSSSSSLVLLEKEKEVEEHIDVEKVRSLLARVRQSRLTPEVALLFMRAVGLLCPEQWAEALNAVAGSAEVRHTRVHRHATLWLMAQGSWTAALHALTQQLKVDTDATSRALAVDTVLRTAVPINCLHRLLPPESRPSVRLRGDVAEPVTRQIAAALARGVRVDNVQLSVAGKQWALQGRWLNALHLYYRFPVSEFQKQAARSLVKARPALPLIRERIDVVAAKKGRRRHTAQRKAIDEEKEVISSNSRSDDDDEEDGGFNVMSALQLLVPAGGIQHSIDAPPRPSPPLETFPACLLIDAAPSWSTALRVFRACVRRGTQCNAQVLSSLMHHRDLPAEELRRVLRSYPSAVNDGVRRRAKESFHLDTF